MNIFPGLQSKTKRKTSMSGPALMQQPCIQMANIPDMLKALLHSISPQQGRTEKM